MLQRFESAALAGPPGLALCFAVAWQTQLLPPECERRPVTVQGEVQDLVNTYERDGQLITRADIAVHNLTPSTCSGPGKVRVYLSAAPDERSGEDDPAAAPTDLLPGALVLIEARLRRPRGYVNPSARAGEREDLLRGVHARGSGTLVRVEEPPRGHGFGATIDRARARLSTRLQETYPGPAGALLAALSVGDKRGLRPVDWERMRDFGLSHLFVISGLHVSYAALLGWSGGGLVTRMAKPPPTLARALPAVGALATAGAYALAAGFALPTRRALLMLSVLLLPRALGRRADPVRALALAVIGLLTTDPVAILGPSFWLSVGAVTLLCWFALWRPSGQGVRHFITLQVFLILAMTPLTLLWFGAASGTGAIVNLAAIPIVTLIVLPCLLLGLSLEMLHLAFSTIPLGVAAAVLNSGWSALGWLEIEGESLIRGVSPRVGGLLLMLGFAALAAPLPPFLWRTSILGLLGLPALVLTPPGAHSKLELTVFDVGQGTAVLLEAGSHSLLYDTGPGPAEGPAVAERTVLPYLLARGARPLDVMVISHPDLDHAAGESAIRRHVPVERVLRGVTRVPGDEACRAGQTLRLGSRTRVRVLSGAVADSSDNNASCVILVTHAGRRFLLPGDIDRGMERAVLAFWPALAPVDVALAAHHGSDSSSSHLWLRRLAPDHLVVTAGYRNRFGHPSPSMVARARERDVRVLETSRSGALVYSVDDRGVLKCRRLRHRYAPFWRWGPHPRDCSPESSGHAGIIRANGPGDA